MPEISEERLAELEAMEMIVTRFVLPEVKRLGIEAQRERVWKYPYRLTDEEAMKLVHGCAIVDDPPTGWGPKKLADWARAYLDGREVVGLNFSGRLRFMVHALSDPRGFWRDHQLGFLRLCDGAQCSCGGFYMTDENRLGLACDKCHTFLSYEQVCKEERRIDRRERLQHNQQERSVPNEDHPPVDHV